ncbi:MAG: polyprenol monophosphomannose synthase [Gemmatimonadetes bacterium]|nr:polyprenol monophosphomannose synthase [Gemmatimonadota bacterium]MYH20043.1 polyprenol monophosphomannose synthase [Gemmatimonadota bacterium]MYK99449.1 polyprenol monophosphomannose synthase [Gemmatimonadota bacterium]
MKSLIIVPTYNELENIRRLLPELMALGPDIRVLVVDDNSPDGTGKLADELAAENERISVLHRAEKQGLGSAYVAGFSYAIQQDVDCVFEMDADFSHDPAMIPRFIEEIASCDVVIGSRYISGINVVNWPMSRLLLSYFANIYTRVVTGMTIRDTTSGFKCFRREVLEHIDLDRVRSDGYAFQIEMNFRCWRKGYRMREIPIIFVDRRSGTSKLSRGVINEAVWIVWWLRLQRLLRRL